MANFPLTTASQSELMVRKNVGFIHTSGDLSLIAHRLSNVLLYFAYRNLTAVPAVRTHTIKVSTLTEYLNFESKNTAVLKEALKSLITTCIEFNLLDKSGKEKWKAMTILSFAEISDGVCTYRYDEEMEAKIRDAQVYAYLSLEIQNQFTSTYALRLYENCNRFKGSGSTGEWSIPLARRILGAKSSSLDEFKRLKQRVIDPSVNEINKVSDINVSVKFNREARTVVGMTMLVSQKSKIATETVTDVADKQSDPLVERVKAYGIPALLAETWASEDREHLESAVKYVDDRKAAGKITGSAAGYLRSLVDSKADMSASKVAAEMEEQARLLAERRADEAKAERMTELRTEFSNHRFNHLLASISPGQMEVHARRYKAEATKCESDFDVEKMEFSNRTDNIMFKGWLRGELKSRKPTEAEFQAWLKKRSGAAAVAI